MTDAVGHAVIDLMLARRSVRQGFAGAAVAKHDLDLIIRCGPAAPSSSNAQPWRLHVVRDKSTLESIAEAVRGAEGLTPTYRVTHA